MRVRLHRDWPELSATFGLYPDDVPRFSAQEWSRYLEALDDLRQRR